MTTRRLIFIAGPTAVGKSTLISRLMAGELDDVRHRLGLRTAEEWHVLDGSELPSLRAASPARTVLCHYDILHFLSEPATNDAGELFAGTEECRVVTLWAAPATLQERIVKRDFHGRPPAPTQKSNWNGWLRRGRRLPRGVRNYLGRCFVHGRFLGRLMRHVLDITPMEPIFQTLDRYRDPASVAALYESWRKACVAAGAEQVFIDTTDGSYRFVEQPPW